ncbi:MAG: hypothetical protein Q7S40_01335 [Opitutaceae bacterium]|nr:hypothetical protein [Opitutaceae bacterium]
MMPARSRRCLLRILALAVLLAGSGNGITARGAAPISSVAELRTLREQAATRARRVIFNNDGNEPVYLCKTSSPAELLSHRTTPLRGTHVDAIFYCTWSSGFGLFTHDTKVGQVFATKEGLFERNLAPTMLAAGTDPLRVMTDFGREHGIEIFWSFRLNDTHDGSTANYGPIMFRANRLKQEHPEWLIGTPKQKPKFGAWSAVDFTRSEIRELAFRFVEEVCHNYPVDGVEIDFFRHPVFFKRAAQTGTACDDDERQMMTELLRRIREMSEVEGMKRGRPILLAVRVPDSVEYCRAIGIDLERWLADGFVDLLITGGYFQLNDPAYSVALGRKYGVRVYPSLDDSRVRDPDARKLRASAAAYRGRALHAWRAGAGGVYLFNSFDPKNPIWRELGSAATLAAADKDYFGSVLGPGAAAGGSYPHQEFQNGSRLNPANPITVKPGSSTTTVFAVGDDFRGRARAPEVKLRLQFKLAPAIETLAVSLNGEPVTRGEVDGDWIAFTIDAARLKPGANEVQLVLAKSAPAALLTDLHCTVRTVP